MPMLNPSTLFYLQDTPGGYGNAPEYHMGDPDVQAYVKANGEYRQLFKIKLLPQGILDARGVLTSYATAGSRGQVLAGYFGYPTVEAYLADHPGAAAGSVTVAPAASTQRASAAPSPRKGAIIGGGAALAATLLGLLLRKPKRRRR